MCGLIGFSGKENFNKEKIKTLILWNSLMRGVDSTGLYSPINGLKKSLLAGNEFIVEDKEDFLVDNFLIAHVRAKTIGKNSIENTHPFHRGNYLLCHNGTLKNHIDLIDKYSLNIEDYNVDSDIVCGCLNQSKNILDVIKHINGPAAFMITDTENTNILYVFRNKERTLFKGYIGADMYISSIAESLKFIGCNAIKEFKEDILYKIKDGTIITSTKIKNEPYAMPIIYNANNNIDNSIYLNCWVRASFNITFNDGNFSFKMIKNKYYKTIKIEKNSVIKLYDDVSKANWNINLNNLEQCDFIKQNDYVKVISNINSNASDIVLLKTDDIVIVRTLWETGEISVYDSINKNFIGLVDKSMLVKLDYDEIFNFKVKNKLLLESKTLKNNQTFLDLLENNSKPKCINYESDIENENAEKEDEDAYYDLMINEEELTNYFEKMDDKLENLNMIISNNKATIPELQEIIVDLIDLNFTNANYFTQTEITT